MVGAAGLKRQRKRSDDPASEAGGRPASTESGRLPRVTIYTDGGCSPNPGPGGWGAVLLYPRRKPVEISGGEPDTTNNRMELRAAIEALSGLEKPCSVELFTDSEYLKRGITEWLPRWQRNGWVTATKTAVKNQDLWRALAGELARHEVAWRWTKGHAGNRWNERADRLASSAIPKPGRGADTPGAVHVYCAAALAGASQRGGWCAVLTHEDRRKVVSGAEEQTTANRMHLRAAVAGLEALKRPTRIHLVTASDYLKQGATAWVSGWKARGWRTKDGQPVKNRDLWERLDELAGRAPVSWQVVDSTSTPDELSEAKRVATRMARGEDPDPSVE